VGVVPETWWGTGLFCADRRADVSLWHSILWSQRGLASHSVVLIDRLLASARARWVRNDLGHTVIFDEEGPFAGTVICLSGLVAVQLALHLFKFEPS